MKEQIEEDIMLLEHMYKIKEIDTLHLSILEFIVDNRYNPPSPHIIYKYLEGIIIPEIFDMIVNNVRNSEFYKREMEILTKINELELEKNSKKDEFKPSQLRDIGFPGLTSEIVEKLDKMSYSKTLIKEKLEPLIEKGFLEYYKNEDFYYTPLKILKKKALIEYVRRINNKQQPL